MAVKPISHAWLINSAMSPTTKPPAGLAFLCGVCETLNINYTAYDINIEFLKYSGQEIWEQVFANTGIGTPLDKLPTNLQKEINSYIDYAVNLLVNSNPDCICITITTFMQQSWAEQFLRKVKSQSKIPVIAGGPGVGIPYHCGINQFESFGSYMINEKLFDYYILGEGDFVLQKFLLGERDNIGLNGHDCSEQWQPQIENLNQVPIPSYRNIPLDLYTDNNIDQRRINITGSRGCVRRCSFCDVGHIWKKFRYRSGQHIVNEMIQHYQETGATNFWFTDSLVNGSIKQFTAMLENILERSSEFDHKKIQMSGNFIVRPQQSHPEKMFELMYLAGFREPLVGIESGSESVRTHIGKKFSNDDINWHFEMSEKYKIKNWVLMMVGYPTETDEDFQDTKNLLVQNQKYIINQTILGINIWDTFTLLPNTPLFNMREELGLVQNDSPSGSRYTNWNSLSNPSLTPATRNIRFLELLELAIDLRYPLPAQIQHYFDQHRPTNSDKISKQFIPIQSMLS